MTVRQDTLWQQFLSPIIGSLLDRDRMLAVRDRIDWTAEIARIQPSGFVYPDYYAGQNTHGIEGGYLTQTAAITYDPITFYVLPPYEPWVRQSPIAEIDARSRRILDLGCGVGSMTFLLKQAFPGARVTGLDLSPYMLAVAQDNSLQMGMEIEWQHGMAEATPFESASFDTISIALLLHETPTAVSHAILAECYRLLAPGGQIVILDGNQKLLRALDFLNNIFEEPYIKDYAAGNLDAWLGRAGFECVHTREMFGIHQVTSGVKI